MAAGRGQLGTQEAGGVKGHEDLPEGLFTFFIINFSREESFITAPFCPGAGGRQILLVFSEQRLGGGQIGDVHLPDVIPVHEH